MTIIIRNSSKKDPKGTGNTKQSPPRKNWCFTFNNYTPEEFSSIVQHFNKNDDKYVIGEEVGEKDNTPHLQGCVSFKTKKRLTALKKLNIKIHWEPCRGSWKSNVKYCRKDGKYVTNLRLPRIIKFPVMNLDWEIYLLNIIKDEPDDRTIYWIWSDDGNKGKTTFCKYLHVHHNAISVPPKTADAFHGIAKHHELDEAIDLVVIDIPRISQDCINYGAIEKIKDGYMISGKYKGAEIVIACPHVFVFANIPPDETKMSSDRWSITEI